MCLVRVRGHFYNELLLLFSVVLGTFQPLKSSDAVVPTNLYAICALTYMLAMVSSNLDLQWVPYPTQVIGKSCKPIPVMLLGVLLGGRSYSLKKYFFVLLIVIGVGLFMYKPKTSASKESSTGDNYTGELLLVMSLAMDGLTAATQERMRGKSRPNSSQMMKMMNLFSIGYALIGLLATGEIFTFTAFVSRHPSVMFKILTFSIASALGQFFIYVVVSDFGPLPCSIITTTRKFFTVLASVLLFGNVLGMGQWIGTGLVFVGLGLDAIYT